MNNNEIQTKEQFIESVRKWVLYDSQLKVINEKTKKVRDAKTLLTNSICDYASKSNLKKNQINITGGSLSFYEKKEYSALTYGYLEKCLGEIISDKRQVDYIIKYLKDNRDIQYSQDIRRTITNELQITNS